MKMKVMLINGSPRKNGAIGTVLKREEVIVAAGENYGKQDVVKILRKLVLYSGGRNCGSLSLNVEFEKGIKMMIN